LRKLGQGRCPWTSPPFVKGGRKLQIFLGGGWAAQRRSGGDGLTATHFFVKKKFSGAGRRRVPRPMAFCLRLPWDGSCATRVFRWLGGLCRDCIWRMPDAIFCLARKMLGSRPNLARGAASAGGFAQTWPGVLPLDLAAFCKRRAKTSMFHRLGLGERLVSACLNPLLYQFPHLSGVAPVFSTHD